MYTLIYIYIDLCIHTHTHTHIYIHICIYIYIYIYIYMYSDMHICIYIYVYLYIHVYVYMFDVLTFWQGSVLLQLPLNSLHHTPQIAATHSTYHSSYWRRDSSRRLCWNRSRSNSCAHVPCCSGIAVVLQRCKGMLWGQVSGVRGTLNCAQGRVEKSDVIAHIIVSVHRYHAFVVCVWVCVCVCLSCPVCTHANTHTRTHTPQRNNHTHTHALAHANTL